MVHEPESDSESELPPGWEERTTDDKVYYAKFVSLFLILYLYYIPPIFFVFNPSAKW